MRIVMVLVAVLVCAASATSYRQSYKESNLGNGVFMVVVEVNGQTSAATARQYAFQRASEVCGGSGFSVLDSDGNSYAGATVMTTQNVGNVNITTANETSGGHDFTLMYACNGGSVGGRDAVGNGHGAGVTRPEDLPRQ